MKTSVYITNATIGKGTGGGIVAYNESLALSNVTLLSRSISRKDIDPLNYQLPNNPFFYDYLASYFIQYTKVDIAHLYGGPFTLTVHTLQKNGAKVFITIAAHNLELSIEEHERLGMKYPYIHMTDPFLSQIYNQYIKDADIVICPSKLSANYTKQKLNLTHEPIIIPHGCELPKEAKPFPEKFDAGYLGQAGPDKGIHYLIQAWSKLNLPKETLILAGTDPSVIASYLTSAKGNYHLAGYVPEVSEIYNKCSVYVQPTVTEAFGIPVLEAMAHGRPVIVTEGAGVHETVEDGKEGFIVPIRDAESIANCITYFRENPSEIQKFGKNARLKAEQYTWDKIRKMYEEVYLESS
jgi:glycosyltransferase involved in cell wall biosynthesis